MKTLNNIALMLLFSIAFMFTSTDANAGCEYDSSQLTFSENANSVYIYPFGGFEGEFLVQWREKDTGDPWIVSELITSHVFTLEPLKECTKYEFCIRKKCGPAEWSDWSEIFCVMTLCDCPCDSPIEINTPADAYEFYAYLYANEYIGIPHYFEWGPVGGPYTTTQITTEHFSTLFDLNPCTKYEYRVIVYCPEYKECPEACEIQGGTQVSPFYTFMTPGCHDDDGIAPVECCDYIFMVDNSGSMNEDDILEAECEIQNFINTVQDACPDCASNFAITNWASGTSSSNILSNFDCDPTVDLGDHSGGGTNIGNAGSDVADWLDSGELNSENKCLHVVIYTDAGCSQYNGYEHGVQDLLDAGATSVSLVAFENHDCEGVEETITAAGGVYTETNPGDCTEKGGITKPRSSKRIYKYDPNDPDKLLEVIEPGKQASTEQLKVYPMPFSDVINIDVNLETESDITIEIYNTMGTVVHRQTKSNRSKGNQTISIDNTLPQGTYSYKISFDSQTFTGNLLKI